VNKRFRLKKSSDFQRVRRLGKAIAHPFVVLLYLPNELDQVRVGVAAGKSIGKAVQRNRAKRVMRAAIQPHLNRITSGYDFLLIAREPILSTTAAQLGQILNELLEKAKLISDKYEHQS
jgi:ribonuclease P protein component